MDQTQNKSVLETKSSKTFTSAALDATEYKCGTLTTSITLLSSTEDEIIFKVLRRLAMYADQGKSHLRALYGSHILPHLSRFIQHDKPIIVKYSMKLIAQLVGIIPAAAKDMNDENRLERIGNIILTTQDPDIKKYACCTLSRTAGHKSILTHLLLSGIMKPVFEILESSRDPKIQEQALLLLNNLLEIQEKEDKPMSPQDFSIRTLMCYLNNKVLNVKMMAVDVVGKLILLKRDELQEILANEHLIERLMKIIIENENENLRGKAFCVIHNCMKLSETQYFFVNSLEFIEFCQWATTLPKLYLYDIITILNALTKIRQLRQMLFDFSVHNTIVSFIQQKNKHLICKSCEAVINLSLHRYCSQQMVTKQLIYPLLCFLQEENLSAVPYHKIIVGALHGLLKTNVNTLTLLVDDNADDIFLTILIKYRNDDRKYPKDTTLLMYDMLHTFCSSSQYKKRMFTAKLYKLLICSYVLDETQLAHKALQILLIYVRTRMFLEIFWHTNGPAVFVRTLKKIANELLFKDTLIFISLALRNKKLYYRFIQKKCVAILKSMRRDNEERIPLIDGTINYIYNLNLSYKFYNSGKLDITDRFNCRFYVLKDPKQCPFQSLDDPSISSEELASFIYLVDFSVNVDGKDKRRSRKLSKTVGFKKRSVSVTIDLPKQSLNRSRKVSNISKVHSIVKTPTRLRCTTHDVNSKDPKLHAHTRKLKHLVYKAKRMGADNRVIIHIVAHFVDRVLSKIGTCSLNLHLTKLQDRLCTNIIPLGSLQRGGYCERALLFKALAEKVGISTTLVRKKIETGADIYWNEVLINIRDHRYETKRLARYAVVDLVENIGTLLLDGTSAAHHYRNHYRLNDN